MHERVVARAYHVARRLSVQQAEYRAMAATQDVMHGLQGLFLLTCALDLVLWTAMVVSYLLGLRLSDVCLLRTHSLEIGASLFSVAALCTVTAFVMRDAVGRLSRSRGGEAGSGEGSGEVEGEVEGEEVDPIIMLTFTCFNLLVDFGMFASILLRRRGGGGGSACCLCPYFLRPAPPNAAASDELQDEAAEGGAGAGGAAGGAAAEDAAALNLNMCSALAHVVADTMRTLTVMGCALLVAFCGYDAEHTDAMGSLLVCCIVLAIAAYISFEATAELHAHRRRARAEAGGALQLARSEAMPRIVEEC